MSAIDKAAALRELRTALDKTQEEMAVTLGDISGDSVSLYELGKRPVPGPVWRLIQQERLRVGLPV